MKTRGLLKSVGTIVALAIVSACSNGSTVAPSTAGLNASYVGRTLFVNGKPVTAARAYALPTNANLLPEKSKSKDYEYIFNEYQTYASIFNYPKSTKMVEKLNGAGGQGCTNTQFGYGKGIVWNAGRNYSGSTYIITEFQVPSNKVIKSLPLDYENTSSCAMDTSGDLAVGVLCSNSCGPAGEVEVFKNATGKPIVYKTPLDREYFDGYDPSGNLFADGQDSSGTFALVELPKGSSKAVTISTSNSPEFPGSVQWDGKYITVFDQDTAQTYQYTVTGTTAKLVNTVTYTGSSDCAQTWLVKGLMYCGDNGYGGEVYKYPQGGAPIAEFSGSFVGPLGVTAIKK